jgi:hypothetical protein
VATIISFLEKGDLEMARRKEMLNYLDVYNVFKFAREIGENYDYTLKRATWKTCSILAHEIKSLTLSKSNNLAWIQKPAIERKYQTLSINPVNEQQKQLLRFM